MPEEQNIEEIIKRETGKALELSVGIEGYFDSLRISEDELIALIKNKKVLDLGSSDGRFAKECALRNIPTQVYSISPRLALESFRAEEKGSTGALIDLENFKLKEALNREEKKVKRAQVQETHDATAVSAFAQALPFESESFDVILDVYAVFHYVDLDNFTTAVQEEYRLLKPGGEIRMVSAAQDDDSLKPRRNKLEELQIPFEEIKSKDDKLVYGFRILKPVDEKKVS